MISRRNIHFSSTEIAIYASSASADSQQETPPWIDCSVIRSELYLIIDQECDPLLQSLFLRHISLCRKCVEIYNIELALKGLIHKCCSGISAPEHLLESICHELFGDISE